MLASSLSLDAVPRLCRLRTVHCWPLDQDFCKYWPHTLVSLIPWLFHYAKRLPRTGSGRCEISMYPSYGSIRDGARRWNTVFSGSADRFPFWRIQVKVDMCRSRTYICCVVRKPQLALIDSNHHLLYGNRRLVPCTIIVVNQWKHGYLGI